MFGLFQDHALDTLSSGVKPYLMSMPLQFGQQVKTNFFRVTHDITLKVNLFILLGNWKYVGIAQVNSS